MAGTSTPIGGYSSWRSLEMASNFTYKWLGRPPIWSLQYRQSSQPEAGTVYKVTLPVNTNARIDHETLPTRLGAETEQVT